MEKILEECISNISNFPILYNNNNFSPLEIIRKAGYIDLFHLVTEKKIYEYLATKEELINEWIQYSKDIRHLPAWGFGPLNDEKWVTTIFDGINIEKYIYDNKFEACAKMVKMTAEQIRNEY